MSKRPKIGIGVFIVNDQKQFLLGKRLGSHGAEAWSIPGGHLEYGESFEECAIREVKEETGLTIQDPRFLQVTNNVFHQEEKHSISIFMTADYPVGQKVQNPEPHKIESWEWFSLKNLPEKLFLPIQNFFEGGGYGRGFSLDLLWNFNEA